MGVKGVKSGNMAKLRNLTEKDLWTMSRKEMEELLYSTSKNITASVRKLMKSEYKDISAFVSQREKNKYAMPREIEFRTELPKTLVGKVAYRVLEEEANRSAEVQG